MLLIMLYMTNVDFDAETDSSEQENDGEENSEVFFSYSSQL